MTTGHTNIPDRVSDAESLRVLHVIAPASFGGLEQVVRQLVTGRVARGLPTRVLAFVARGASSPSLVELLLQAGVQIEVRRTEHRAYREERRAIQEAATTFRADVVHTHGYRPDVLAASAARPAGSGLVSTAHGFTGGGLKNRLFEWFQLRAWRHFDVVAAVSRPLHGQLVRSGIPEEVVELCPNAWNGTEPLDRASARERLKLTPSDRIIGWVGRLSREKGPDILVRALTHLPSDIIAVMTGDGQEREALTQLASELGVSTRITWTGSVHEAGRYMAAFDAFVLTSRSEGTPLVLFEAMAARVPIVATSVGGVPDVLSPAEALLVRPKSPEELADAIAMVFRDHSQAAKRAAAARLRLEEHYAPGRWLDRYERFYMRAGRTSARR